MLAHALLLSRLCTEHMKRSDDGIFYRIYLDEPALRFFICHGAVAVGIHCPCRAVGEARTVYIPPGDICFKKTEGLIGDIEKSCLDISRDIFESEAAAAYFERRENEAYRREPHDIRARREKIRYLIASEHCVDYARIVVAPARNYCEIAISGAEPYASCYIAGDGARFFCLVCGTYDAQCVTLRLVFRLDIRFMPEIQREI
ncbi:unknown [Candidatus Apopatosoma intestinale]|nr:unknown [Candidatus Apopatosoma intestinale]